MRKMKVLMINGSPNLNGATAKALKEMETIFVENGIEVKNVLVGNKDVRGCVACGKCRQINKCVFDDIVNELALEYIYSNASSAACS